MKKITSFLLTGLLLLLFNGVVWGQTTIYLHDFGTSTISIHPYTVAPGTFSENLSSSSWTNSNSAWTSFAGSAGQAISLNNSSGTPTITLTFTVAPGYKVSITQFNFWRQRSASGAQNWSMKINNIAVGSGTVPTAGAAIGATNVSNSISNLTNTVTVELSLSGASGTGTFRLDDFTLIGTVEAEGNSSPTVTTQAVSSIGVTTATGNGNITSIGGVNPTVRGFCWDLASEADPDIADSKTTEEGSFSTGAFTGNLTGLTAGTEYKARAYATNSEGTAYGSVVTFKTLSAEPTSQSSDISFSGVTETGFTINWTNGNGTNRIVLVKSGSAVNSDPIDGTSYTANTAFGSGTQIGTGNYVVYNSTSNSVTVTALTASTTYHVAIYEFNGASGTENYLLTPAINSQSTNNPTLGWQISSVDNLFNIDFDNTVSGVNNGQFTGIGFSTSPSIGQLNSNAWAVTGWSDGDLNFGGTRTTSSTDYTRGNSNGGVSSGGIYSFLVGTSNRALGIQPGGSDWAPGTLTLRLQNQSGEIITSLGIKYFVYIYNDQGRSNSFNFSHSSDDNTYTDENLNLTSTEAADGGPSWKLYLRSIEITGLNIADEGYYFLRWSGADVGGAGSRDEFALDDISLVANPSSVNPTISGTVEEMIISGNNSLSGNLTVQGNITLNNGTINTGNYVLTANNISGFSPTSYIVTSGSGGLKRNVPTIEAGTIFPVGTESSYNPVTITNSGTADNFTVSVKETFDNAPVDPTKVVNRQWSISEDTPGGSNAAIKLQWNTAEEAGSFIRTNAVYVGHYTGGTWQQTAATYVDLESGSYTVEASGFTSFSPFGIGNEGALPVELSSFSALPKANAVQLTWTTATEINNFGFEIERSQKLVVSSESTTWQSIGFVKGNGNSNSPREYSYTDNTLNNSGKYIYRLKQIDNDGTVTYSNEIETDVTVVLEYGLSQNYPNPFNPATVINYTLAEPGFVTIKVYNMLGEEVTTLINGQTEAGKHTLQFDGHNLSSGMYLYKITAGNFTQVKKMLLTK